VGHRVLVVKDGRCYWGKNALRLTAREVKAHYSHGQQVEESFGCSSKSVAGGCSGRNHQAQWAHLHLGGNAFVLTQQTTFACEQTIYTFRHSLFLHSIPQNSLTLQEFVLAA